MTLGIPLAEDEWDALADMQGFGPVPADRFEFPSVTDETLARLVAAGAAKKTARGFVITAAGKRLLDLDSRCLTSGLRVVKWVGHCPTEPRGRAPRWISKNLH